ncbi:MAG: protein phosphatase 2C domain-containing protein [Proteiniphilum sp.]
MGGYEYGARIAELVVREIVSSILKNIPINGYKKLILTQAMEQANSIVERETYKLHAKLGCAVSVCLFVDNHMYFSWLGNVRIYQIRDKSITQLTQDHVLPGYPTILTRCINGKHFEKTIPHTACRIKSDDRYVICTDGFYNYVDEQTITEKRLCEFISNLKLDDDASVIEITVL